MPFAARRPCTHPGCAELTDSGRCAAHAVAARRQSDARRGSGVWLYDRHWRKLRAWQLAEHPLCVECEHAGRIVPATDVDHVIPHRGDSQKFGDPENLQSLCHSCHSRKTAREDNGFGNARR